MTFRRGVTRWVLLVGGAAVKVPSPESWRQFLMGLLANMHERLWWRGTGRDPRLCPVVFAIPGGVLSVMRRTRPVPAGVPVPWAAFAGLPLDFNRDNVGLLDKRFVLTDYGN